MSGPSEHFRRFWMLGLVGLTLLLSLAAIQISLPVLGFILFLAVATLVVFLRSIDRDKY